MSVLAWLLLGLAGGVLAGWLAGHRGRMLLADAVVGTLGAILGGFLAAALLGLDVVALDLTSLVAAAIGGLILILILHALPPSDVYE